MATEAIRRGRVVNTSLQFHDFITERLVEGKKESTDEEQLKDWTQFRVTTYYTYHIKLGDVERKERTLTGVDGTLSTYQFAGACNPGVVVTADTVDAKAKGFDYVLQYKLATRKLSCPCSKCGDGIMEGCLMTPVVGSLFGNVCESNVFESIRGENDPPLTAAMVTTMKVPELRSCLARRDIAMKKGIYKQELVALLLAALEGERALCVVPAPSRAVDTL
jgi:hypothetical protein